MFVDLFFPSTIRDDFYFQSSYEAQILNETILKLGNRVDNNVQKRWAFCNGNVKSGIVVDLIYKK